MKNKKYDIDSIRVYQSVQFEKKQFTFFSTREINNTPGVEIEIIYDLQSISVKSKDDHIIIPLTNISCVYLKSPKRIREAKEALESKLKISAVGNGYVKK